MRGELNSCLPAVRGVYNHNTLKKLVAMQGETLEQFNIILILDVQNIIFIL